VTGSVVATKNLCKQYRSGQSLIDAISSVSLIVSHGEFVAICGRSGSGKSTLMNLLGLLERPDSGHYLLDGKEVSALSERQRATIRNRKIGFVFQLPTLLPRSSALENVELLLVYSGIRGTERKRRAAEALERVGLGHRRYHWPNQLSGGEQQRVAIARALVNKPALILADEPTGALDSSTSDEIMSLFEELHQERSTIIVVTHDPDVAKRAERCVTLHDGRIVEDSSRKQPVVLRSIPGGLNELSG
jgi:putative ABC transport system ATP-binding protein